MRMATAYPRRTDSPPFHFDRKALGVSFFCIKSPSFLSQRVAQFRAGYTFVEPPISFSQKFLNEVGFSGHSLSLLPSQIGFLSDGATESHSSPSPPDRPPFKMHLITDFFPPLLCKPSVVQFRLVSPPLIFLPPYDPPNDHSEWKSAHIIPCKPELPGSSSNKKPPILPTF